MGDPRKPKKQYQTPMHPWQKERIEEEKKIIFKYGLKNKQDVWRSATRLKNYIAKYKDATLDEKQREKERTDLINHLVRFGIINKGAKGEEILDLSVESVLERRLQTVVCRKGFARTMKQARQFITHRHIMVGGRVVTAPSYLVSIDEESTISFISRSPMTDVNHPERAAPEKAPKKKEAKAEETVEAKQPEEPAAEKAVAAEAQ